jgi:signal transduction histidine kinase
MGTTASPPFRVALLQDAVLAVAVGLLTLIGTEVRLPDDLWAGLPTVGRSLTPTWAEVGLVMATSLPLALRRIAPLPVLAACITGSLGLQVIGNPSPLPLAVLVAVCTVAMTYRPLVSIGAAATYLCLLAGGIATRVARITDDYFYVYLISTIATVALGYGLALGRLRAGMAERRSAEIQREQEERTRAAVEQEQARIAREVHDIVAHDVTVIVAQAAAASRVLPADAPAAQTLRAIETAGRDALDGMRRLLHLLRTDGRNDLRSPQPTLGGLPSLVAQVRSAGLPVDLAVHGDERRLPSTVETNAYRIVQEALTNALKHAGPARAAVVLDYGPDLLEVEVRDDGRGAAGSDPDADAGPPTPSGGFGLVGMRQRAALLEGSVDAGPAEAGGFRVTARLPVRGS